MSKEIPSSALHGWPVLFSILGLALLGIALVIAGGVLAADTNTVVIGDAVVTVSHTAWPILMIVLGALLIPLAFILLFGHFTLQPNEAKVLILFGHYKGTVRESGFWWANPFYSKGGGGLQMAQAMAAQAKSGGGVPAAVFHVRKYKVSLRLRTFNGPKLKVNDKRGNPIEIAAMVIWRVQETAQALFDVDDFESYVEIQTESALRHLASLYPYDNLEGDEVALRSHMEEVSQALKQEIQVALRVAGLVVEEARLTHLAYASEIASVMLRRQQAEAVIAARQKIVHGAVGMVEMALDELAKKKVVNLDEERKAAMVSNLLVVLCGETEVHPIINTGTLYT